MVVTGETPERSLDRSVISVLVLLMAIVTGCASGRSPGAAQVGPCSPGETLGCLPPDLLVQYPASTTESHLAQDMSSIFQTKAEVQQFHGSVLQADYPRHRLLVSWLKDWASSRQDALMAFLRSRSDVESVTRA